MRERIHVFVQALRARGMEISVAEALDAMRAVAAAGWNEKSCARRWRPAW